MKYFIFSKHGKLLYEIEKVDVDLFLGTAYEERGNIKDELSGREVASFLARKKREGKIINDDNGYIDSNGFWGQVELMRLNY